MNQSLRILKKPTTKVITYQDLQDDFQIFDLSEEALDNLNSLRRCCKYVPHPIDPSKILVTMRRLRRKTNKGTHDIQNIVFI